MIEKHILTLDNLMNRFPFGNYKPPGFFSFSSKVPSVKIAFEFFCAFRPQQKAYSYDPQFEMGSMLWNLAALTSRQVRVRGAIPRSPTAAA